MLTLRAGEAAVDLHPGDGGRIGQITVDGRTFLRGDGQSEGWAYWGSYPLLPWCNRIPGGELRFEGNDYRLPVNWPDGTAIHGLTAWRPWDIDAADDTTAALRIEVEQGPYTLTCRQSFALAPTHLDQVLEVVNDAGHRVPVGLGIHPWFAVGPVALPAESVWPAVDCLPVGAPRPVTGDEDLRTPTLPPPMDTCFTGLTGTVAAIGDLTLSWRGPVTQLVVYSERPPWVCVEPVTMANDGFRLHDEGVPGNGTIVLGPGRSASVEYRFAWVREST